MRMVEKNDQGKIDIKIPSSQPLMEDEERKREWRDGKNSRR